MTGWLGGESVAGGKLKATGTQYWTSPNTGATNESGFAALPGGTRDRTGAFVAINQGAYWYSSLDPVSNPSLSYGIWYQGAASGRNGNDFRQTGMSVRCMRAYTPPVALAIDGIQPSLGVEGDTITVSGSGFSTIAANNLIKFNGVSAEVIGTPTDSLVRVKVPVNATTGQITVEVAGKYVSSVTDFTVVTPAFPNTGVEAWYPFLGNARDESGGGNDGTVNGPVLTSDKGGVSNQAYVFDGNDKIVLTRAFFGGTRINEFSMHCRFKVATPGGYSLWSKMLFWGEARLQITANNQVAFGFANTSVSQLGTGID